MHAQAIIASSINALALCLLSGYAAAVSVTPGDPTAGPSVAQDTAAQDSAAQDGRPDVVGAWREMDACHAAVSAELDRELGERHGLGVSDFEVLDRLAEIPSREWRAQDLAESVHLSQSALSRLVDRLAKTGLVERCACDMDRRGIFVLLTDEGAHRHEEAAGTHRDILANLLPRQR